MKNLREITLKKAEFLDIEFLWYLRNRKETKEFSMVSGKVKWDEHVNWILPILLGVSNKQVFIIKNLRTPIGQIRFDYKGRDEAEISISILKEFWGKGFALMAIVSGIKKQKDIKRFTATIHKDNLPSANLFKKVNFVFQSSTGNWSRYNLIVKK